MKLKKTLKWLLILIALAFGCFMVIGVISTSYRLATAKDVTEAEAEKNAREKLREFCGIKYHKHDPSNECDPSKYLVSARMHGKSPTNPQMGAAWFFEFSDSTEAPRHVVYIAVDIKGNPDIAGFNILQSSVSKVTYYDTGIRK